MSNKKRIIMNLQSRDDPRANCGCDHHYCRRHMDRSSRLEHVRKGIKCCFKILAKYLNPPAGTAVSVPKIEVLVRFKEFSWLTEGQTKYDLN